MYKENKALPYKQNMDSFICRVPNGSDSQSM